MVIPIISSRKTLGLHSFIPGPNMTQIISRKAFSKVLSCSRYSLTVWYIRTMALTTSSVFQIYFYFTVVCPGYWYRERLRRAIPTSFEKESQKSSPHSRACSQHNRHENSYSSFHCLYLCSGGHLIRLLAHVNLHSHSSALPYPMPVPGMK